jgi:hypothetical protein
MRVRLEIFLGKLPKKPDGPKRFSGQMLRRVGCRRGRGISVKVIDIGGNELQVANSL